MPPHRTRNKFEILHLVHIAIGRDELVNSPSILHRKGTESSRNHSNGKVLKRVDSFPQK